MPPFRPRRRNREMTTVLRGQVLKCQWVEPPSPVPNVDGALPTLGGAGGGEGRGGTLRVKLVRPPRPAIVDIELGDALYMFETRQTWRVALFVPDVYRLARGGLVHVEF